jgi:rubrerythrin
MALLTGDEIIEIAMRLEESGEAFYRAAAEKATTDSVKALFEELALQEQYHRRAFQQMGRNAVELTLSPEQWEDFQAYTGALLQQHFFSDPENALNVASEAKDEQAALQAALEFERETLLFFHALRDVIRGREQEVVEGIIQEEQRHIRRISKLVQA